ncbi:MAG: hypothetical protein DMG07_16160 [Acidobacteria bacterium]|nr:MAG: hypothetical protein DMG07_16160 [Acidobacteriota bacterium]
MEIDRRRFLQSAAVLPAAQIQTGRQASEPAIGDLVWERGPNLPRPVKGQAQGVVEGKILYTCGFAFDHSGYTRPGPEAAQSEVDALMRPRQIRYCRETWLFDPTAGKFSRLPDAPVGVFWPAGAVVGDDFYLLTGTMREAAYADKRGWQPGEKHDVTSRRVFRLSRRQGDWRWEELPGMRIGRFLPAVAAVGSMLYVIGGAASFGAEPMSGDRPGPYINAVEALDVARREDGWRDIAPLPGMGRYDPSVAVVRGKVYLFGGFYDHLYHVPAKFSRFCGDAYCYDPGTRRWDQLPDLPFALNSAKAVTVRDRYVIMAGGRRGGGNVEHPFTGDKSGEPRANLETLVYDVERSSYTSLPSRLPPAPTFPKNFKGAFPPEWGGHWLSQAALIGEDVYLLGGEVADLAYSNCSDVMWIGRIRWRTR